MASKVFKIQEHVLPCQHIRQYHRATVNAQDGVLHLSIKQYTPLGNRNPKPGDITIIGAHANGFPKELYEPFWMEFLERTKAAGIHIRNIWIADVSHQGKSGVLNEGKMGDDPSWFDHSRDLLHMINHFRDQIRRPIIGIGHSMGGAQLTNLSLMHTRLFSSLVLIDPVIQRVTTAAANFSPARASTFRRDVWPSRAEAAKSFKKSKFYSVWDPRVLDLWIEYGLRDMPTLTHALPPTDPKTTPFPPSTAEPSLAQTPIPPSPPVTLTTTKHQEVFQFLRPNYSPPDASLPGPHALTTTSGAHNRTTIPDITPIEYPQSPFYRPEPFIIFSQLPHLRPPVLYIYGGESYLSGPDKRADKIANTGIGVGGSGGAAEGKVREYVVQDTGHLVPMEKVEETARESAKWVEEVLGWWKREEQVAKASWVGRSETGKAMVSERWVEEIRKMDLEGKKTSGSRL